MTRAGIELELCCDVSTAVRPSPRVLQVAAMFGLGVDEARVEHLVPATTITLRPGQVVFVHGPSGSGKSTILRLIREAVGRRDDARCIEDEARAEQRRPLVDLLGDTLEEATSRLAAAGLGDAFVMLRSADQLSDGQRARWRLAQLMAAADAQVGDVLPVVLMDEFAATLDRLTAAIMARNVRRWVTRSGVCAVIATTHDDLLEPLAPDVLIYKPLGEAIEVATK